MLPVRGAGLTSLPVLVACAWLAAAASGSAQPMDCGDWRACREAALAAAAGHDFEGFHDLAWRAVQQGPPRDPDLMYLLARAMSLSGRPGDAIVMLRRLAERGVATDAAVHDDFRRVRALPGWPEVEALMAGLEAPEASPASEGALPGPAAVAVSDSTVPAVLPNEAAPAATVSAPATTPGPRPATGALAPPRDAVTAAAASASPAATTPRLVGPPAPVVQIDEAVRLPMRGLSSGGFAYDAVSGRFLLGANPRKIVVVAEESRRVDDLVRADSAGFYDITAMAIDPRRGDLWVVSSAPSADAEAETPGDSRSALHKVQLISGRPLGTLRPEAADGPVRFVDVTVTEGGLVVVLDALGRRVFRAAPGGERLEVAAALGDVVPLSLTTAAGERVAYVAHEAGLLRVDLVNRSATPLAQPDGVDTTGVGRLRWHRGALVAVQAVPGGGQRIVRFALASTGRAVTSVEVLDTAAGAASGAVVAALAGDEFYYAAGVADGDGDGGGGLAGTIVRRVRLR